MPPGSQADGNPDLGGQRKVSVKTDSRNRGETTKRLIRDGHLPVRTVVQLAALFEFE